MGLQRFSLGKQHRKQMVHVPGVALADRAQRWRQQSPIARRQRPAPNRPLREQRQPRSEDGGLQIVETAVHTRFDVLRALHKGARAVQLGAALRTEGVGMFARLEREMKKTAARDTWKEIEPSISRIGQIVTGEASGHVAAA